MTTGAFHLLFVPGGGGAGSGESFRSLALAHAARERWPEARIGFLISRDHADVGFDAFETHVVSGRVSRSDAEVLGVLRRTRPDVVVFDNRGSTTAILEASRLGARVVFIADAVQILRRAFRLRRLRCLDQLWLVQRRFGPEAPTLNLGQRLRIAAAGGPEVHFFDALFADPEAERRGQLLARLGLSPGRYALFAAGGGGHRYDGRPAPEILADAAAQVHGATGTPCVAVMGPLYEGRPPSHEGVQTIPSLPPPQMTDLVSEAGIVTCGGGVTLTQALAFGRLCVVCAMGPADQPERITACSEAGMIEPVPLDAKRLADGVVSLQGDAERQERMRASVAAAGLRNGLSEAVAALAALQAAGRPS